MNKELIRYRLRFTTPLHIGNERADYASGSPTVHSDAFYAAMFFSAARLGFYELLPSDNPAKFSISSLFPFVQQDDNILCFFPRPQFFVQKGNESIADGSASLRKKIKKAAFVDQTIFESLLTGGDTVPYIREENFRGAFWAAKHIQEITFLTSSVVPRASISRDGKEDTRIFYIERHYFSDNAGLFFLCRFENDEVRSKFEATLRFLGEEGIGTDRNVGHGKFEIASIESFRFGIVPNRNLAINLGLYCPSDKQELEEALSGDHYGYDILKRGGWLSEPYNTWRKRSVFMFKEGSCFHTGQQEATFVLGKTVDLKPTEVQPPITHPVWRCGRTLFLSF